jgi:uncharacterized membrane protein
MTHFTISVDIQAPPQRVWLTMRDVERWPEWTPSVTSVQRLDDGPFSRGSRARVRQPKLLPAVWEVTALSEGSSFTWVTRSPGLQVAGRHSVEPRPGGSQVTLALDFTGLLAPLVGRLLGGLNERYLALEANGLKAWCES